MTDGSGLIWGRSRFGESDNEMKGCGCDGNCKKHPCADCSFCQWCSDDRCRMCRARKGSGKKLSVAEQIALYESLNPKKKE